MKINFRSCSRNRYICRTKFKYLTLIKGQWTGSSIIEINFIQATTWSFRDRNLELVYWSENKTSYSSLHFNPQDHLALNRTMYPYLNVSCCSQYHFKHGSCMSRISLEFHRWKSNDSSLITPVVKGQNWKNESKSETNNKGTFF